MDSNGFRESGYEMVDYVVDYLESVSQRRVSSDVSPGYLLSDFPPGPPQTGDSFQEIMEDVENHVMPRITHRHHPGFHASLPSSCSFPAILGNMVGDVLGAVAGDFGARRGELEIVVSDWYGRMIGLPENFLHRGGGSGMIRQSTSDCIFVCMIAARRNVLRKMKYTNPALSGSALLCSLVAYCSKESHPCIENIAVVTLVNVRVLDVDSDFQLRGETLEKAMREDRKIGLIPFFVNVTLGTFRSGSCDLIHEIGPICEKYDVWLNVDASYAGTALACSEYRHLLNGVESAMSFSANPACWMSAHADCSVLFVKNRYRIKEAGCVFDDWDYPSSNSAIEAFFVMRNYGVEHLQKRVRSHVRLAEMFEDCVKEDERFEVVSRQFGVVCFRLTGTCESNQLLGSVINASGKLFLSPTRLRDKCVIRFAVCTEHASEDDIKYAWKEIRERAEEVLEKDPKEVSECVSEMREEM